MTLKQLTAASHQAAEDTAFMKAVFDGKMTKEIWTDFTYQKILFYSAIESLCKINELTKNMPTICRSTLLYQDYLIMSSGNPTAVFKKSTLDYYNYLLKISSDKDKVAAHLYTWHMGDLHGGQMIKRVLPGSHLNLEFDNRPSLIAEMRLILKDSMADEAIGAFNWAIRIMKEYDDQLSL